MSAAPPPEVWVDISRLEEAGRQARAQGALRLSSWSGLVAHGGMLGLFLFLQEPVMAAFNGVVSIPTFVVCVALASRRPLTAARLALAEVLLHAILATWLLGWDSGFHHWLILAVVVPGLVPLADRWPWWPSVGAALLYVSLLAAPRATHVPGWVPVQNMTAMLGCLVLILLGYSGAARSTERALAAAEAQAERLLHAMLPPVIVTRLQQSPQGIADSHDEVAVLFADVVGFTSLSARTSPEVVVDLLNQLFTAFDIEVQARGLLKVKTIGDAYMVAGGIPTPRPDAVEKVADLALAMLRAIEALPGDHGLRMRIGLHCGPAVAGVIGRATPAYDLWGDTVNTASRMESHGEPGRIHVSEAVARRLEGWRLTERGEIQVKGKGPLRTWWLEGR